MPFDGKSPIRGFGNLAAEPVKPANYWNDVPDTRHLHLGQYRDEVIATLRRARKLVARRGGWVQAVHSRPTRWFRTGYCLGGAIDVASLKVAGEDNNVRVQARNHAWMVLQRVIGRNWTVAVFNDFDGRTQAQVVALDSAIALAEQLA